MSDFEFRILRYLHHEESPVLWSKLLNDFSPFAEPMETDSVLKSMLASGIIRKTSVISDPHLCSVFLSDSAVLNLIQEEERRAKLESIRQENERKENEKQKAAEDKERNRLNWEQSCKDADRKAEHAFQYRLSFLNAFLTFSSGLVSGAVLANLDRLIRWLISLFH